MGLDWNPLGKPKPGYEEEFATLFMQLGELSADAGFFEKLRRKRKGLDREAMLERFNEIQITPYETVGAPIVGVSEEANAWARRRYQEMKEPRPPESEFWEKMDGYYVLDLVPPCDGFPPYSNAPCGYVERFSFRGQFLGDCEAIIPEETFAKCYESSLAPGLAILGQELRAAVTTFARARNLEHVEFAQQPDYEMESDESNAHILYCAARWCEYWSSRGHGFEADW
jgi:hypothetical protein